MTMLGQIRITDDMVTSDTFCGGCGSSLWEEQEVAGPGTVEVEATVTRPGSHLESRMLLEDRIQHKHYIHKNTLLLYSNVI